jgi:hypothetical protein
MDGFICICSVDYVVTLHVVNEIYICYSIDAVTGQYLNIIIVLCSC